MKCSKWHILLKEHRVSSLSYLCVILTSMHTNVEPNPGPIEFPCGNCDTEVHATVPALECDECALWLQIQCLAFAEDKYDNLIAIDQSFSWICSNCDHPSFSNTVHVVLHVGSDSARADTPDCLSQTVF